MKNRRSSKKGYTEFNNRFSLIIINKKDKIKLVILSESSKGTIMPCEVKVYEKRKGVFVIVPEGRIFSDSYHIFSSNTEQVLESSPDIIVFDMQEVSFIDSLGISVIVRANMSIEQGKVIIINLKPQIKNVFDILKALPQENILENIEELDEYLTYIQQEINK